MKKSIFKTIGACSLFIGTQVVLGFVFLAIQLFMHPELFEEMLTAGTAELLVNKIIIKASIQACITANVILAIGILLHNIKKKTIHKYARKLTGKEIIIMSGLASGLWVVFNLLEQFLPKSEAYGSTTSAMFDNYPALFILYASLLAPITEELVCRLLVIESFPREKGKIAVVISAIMFGLLHGNLQQAIPAIAIGLIIGLIYERSRNILLTIVFHIIFNSLSVIIMLIGNFYIMIGIATGIAVGVILYFKSDISEKLIAKNI